MKTRHGSWMPYGASVFRCWLTGLLLLLCAGQAWAAVTTAGAGSFARFKEKNGRKGAVFSIATGGECEVVPYAADVVRVSFHWDGVYEKPDVAIDKAWEQWPTVNATFTDKGGAYEITTDQLRVEIVKSPHFHVNFHSRDGQALHHGIRFGYDTNYEPVLDLTYAQLQQDNPPLPDGFKVQAVCRLEPDEAIFGAGMSSGPLNKRGFDLQYYNTDHFKWPEFKTPLYASYPFFYGVLPKASGRKSSYTYGLFFNNPCRPVFYFKQKLPYNEYAFSAGDGQIDYFFFGGGRDHSMPNVLARYTELTGKPCFLPKWTYGYHCARWSYSNQDWIEWLADEFVRQSIPLDALYLDLDYMDSSPDDYYKDNSLKPLVFNSNFPNPKGMIDHCKAKGVQLVPIVEAWLTLGSHHFQEAEEALHFMKNIQGQQFRYEGHYFGDLYWLDYTGSETRSWWKQKLTSFLTAYPFPGIWNDLNEPADPDGEERFKQNNIYWLDGKYAPKKPDGSLDRTDSRQWHQNIANTYCIYQTSNTYDTLRSKFPNQRPFVLSRAGWPGIQKYALGWSGDNEASWNHCRHNIRLGLSVMMSGQVNFGHDVGGFVGNPTPELNTRWHEWAVLTPFCRNHSTKWGEQREPFRYAKPYNEHMAKAIRFRYELMPYLYSLAYESTQSGMPMNTPTVMHFTEDSKTFSQDYDFMVGSHLLAAPVYEANKTSRGVYLPSGAQWYVLPTDRDWEKGDTDNVKSGGQTISVSAPLGYCPLLARGGAIIARGPVMQYTTERIPDQLSLHVWPIEDNAFTLHEDDGVTLDYRSGKYARTELVSDRVNAREWKFTVKKKVGSFNVGARSYLVFAHDITQHTPGSGETMQVKVNGNAVAKVSSIDQVRSATQNAYYFDQAADKLVVRLDKVSTSSDTILTTAYAAGNPEEPSDCFLERLLGGSSADSANTAMLYSTALSDFRTIRDVLNRTTAGRRYVQQYEAFSPDIIAAMLMPENSRLRQDMLALSIQVAKATRQYLNGDRPRTAAFDRTFWNKARATLAHLKAQIDDPAFTALANELNALSYKVEKMTYSQILATLR